MFPLNGPSWSLFFEYIGNILYALFIRRLSTKALTVFVVLLGICLACFAIFDVSGYGMIGGRLDARFGEFCGWTVANAFPVFFGTVVVSQFQTGESERGILDMLFRIVGFVLCSLCRRGRTYMYEWSF